MNVFIVIDMYQLLKEPKNVLLRLKIESSIGSAKIQEIDVSNHSEAKVGSTRNDAMNFILKAKRPLIQDQGHSERLEDAEYDRDFFPLGIRKDLDLPSGVKYSRGRGVFIKRKC